MELTLKGDRRDMLSKNIEGHTSVAAWELEYGVTDTRRFDDIPFMDEEEDEFNIKGDRRDIIFSENTEGYMSRAAWELEYGVTDTRRFDDIPFMDEDEVVNITNWTGPDNIDINNEDNGAKAVPQLEKLIKETTAKTNIIDTSVRIDATPLEAITMTTRAQKVKESIRIKIQKLTRGRRVFLERTKSWRVGLPKPFKACFKH